MLATLPTLALDRSLELFLSRWASRLEIPVSVELWNGRRFSVGRRASVTIRVRRLAGLKALLAGSLDALGKAYVEGYIDVEGHARSVIDLATHIAEKISGCGGPSPFSIRSHTRKVDAESIQYHYDVSNDFYRAWLDPQMVYSCAYFRTPEDTLEQAQRQKIDHILRKIQLRPGHRLLDIGCGWGALIVRAVREFGAHATGITLSQQQFEWANRRIEELGIAAQCRVLLMDYRDVTGQFDRVTSVGMFEHVGLANLRAYFQKITDLLADDGVAMNHGITSVDPDSGGAPLGAASFVDRYVFPNGELPHIGLALREMAAAGLEATDVENLRRHYALTLEHWMNRFEAAGERLRELAGERRYRIWRVYLAGCAHAFAQNWVAIHQVVACKPQRAANYPLPLTRDYMYGLPAK